MIGTLVAAFALAVTFPVDTKEKTDETRLVSAPVAYEDVMLILTDRSGVAAVVFKKEIKNGVHFEYRYVSKNLKIAKRGTGLLIEKFVFKPTDDPKVKRMIDVGSQLFIKIESLSLQWSFSGKGRGWIYYLPELLRVQIGTTEDFETIDLRRFMWLDKGTAK